MLQPPDVDKLVARLALICEQEKVAVDRSVRRGLCTGDDP